MGMSGVAAATSGIGPSSELDDVFLHFYARLMAIPDAQRSVAQATIPREDISALGEWFSDLYKKPRMWCADPWQNSIADAGTASNQQMFGALLIILAAEVCRDKSSEEELWPAVAAVLERDKNSFPLLFDVNRQPGTLCKKAMAEGARRLSLRNLIDCPERQEYVDTVRLQFGFTIQGARKKLPDWLAGLGRPVAVRILCGEESGLEHLKSASFSELWKTLDGYRRRRIERDLAASLLQSSPWVRPGWTEEILTIIEKSSNRVYSTPSASSASAAVDSAFEPVCELALRWDAGAKPRLRLRLNVDRLEEMLGAAGKAKFAVDGVQVGTWTVSEGGKWHGERELPCESTGSPRANLRPETLTISADSTLLAEVHLSELGTNETLTIFDLKSGKAVSLDSRLDPHRDYGFICDTDLSVPGAAQRELSKTRCAFRVAGPWSKDLCAVIEGLPYWTPVLANAEPPARPCVTLESPPGLIAEPDSLSRVLLTGVPADAKLATLTIGKTSYPVVRNDSTWETAERVRITPDMALRKEKLRVHIDGQPMVPKLAIKFLGIACLESEEEEDSHLRWKFLNRGHPLNRADGAGSARILVDDPASWLYEGERRVGKTNNRALSLRDLQGWGAPLTVKTAGGTESVLAPAVVDKGAGIFLPPLFVNRTDAILKWRAAVAPGEKHSILLWADVLQPPRLVTRERIESREEGLVWAFPDSGSVSALAVAHEGARQAAFWSKDLIQRLRQAPSSRLFALLRWLHVPILSPKFIDSMRQMVLRAPADFVTGWLMDANLLEGLTHRPCEPGLDTVIRALLWNHIEKNESAMDRIAFAFQPSPASGHPRSDPEAFKSALACLGQVCPSLAYGHAVKKLRGDKYKRFAKSAAASLLNLPEQADSDQLSTQLDTARRQAAELIGFLPADLESAVSAFAAKLDGMPSDYCRFEPALRRLGETSRGPQFLSASLLLRLVERSRF